MARGQLVTGLFELGDDRLAIREVPELLREPGNTTKLKDRNSSVGLEVVLEPAEVGNPIFDVNGDTAINADDFDHMIQVILGTEFGDANLDGHVDALDLALVRDNFGFEAGWSAGNFNLNALPDANDLSAVRTNFGFSAPPASVPEAGAVALLLFVVLFVHRR